MFYDKQALSKKIKIYNTHYSQEIKTNENDSSCLLWGKPILISEILFHSEKRSFSSQEDLNKLPNKSNINIDKLKEYAAIREIDGRIEIPYAIASMLRRDKYIEGLSEDENKFLCLLNKEIGYPSDKKLTIPEKHLYDILEKHRLYFSALPKNGDELYNDLGLKLDSDIFYIHPLCRININTSFKDEIVAQLWELLLSRKKEKTDNENFDEWLNKCSKYFGNPCPLMSKQSQERFLACVNSRILNSNDLKISNNEFLKFYLDIEGSSDVSLSYALQLMKNFKISTTSYQDLYDSLKEINRLLNKNINHLTLRQEVIFLTRIIIDNDTPNYTRSIKLLMDSKEYPFVFYSILELLKSDYSTVIPFLLDKPELDFIAIDLSSEIKINENLIEKSESKISYERIITEILFDELKILCNELKIDQYGHYSELFQKLLFSTAVKIFSDDEVSVEYQRRFKLFLNYITTPKSFNYNISFEKFYETLLDKMQVSNPSLPNNAVSYYINFPQYYILSQLISFPNHTEEQRKSIATAFIDLISTEFTQTEIIVKIWNTGEVKKEDIYWNEDLYGYELIDWAKLFLEAKLFNLFQSFSHFSKYSYKNKVDGERENQEISRYNRNQTVKLRLIIRILILTYINVNNDKNLFINKGLPCDNLLESLENEIVRIISENATLIAGNKMLQCVNGVLDIDFKINKPNNSDIIWIVGDICNFFSDNNRKLIIDSIEKYLNGLGLLFIFFNTLYSEADRKYICDKVSNMHIKPLIDNIFWLPTLEKFLINAYNSNEFTEIADVLFERYKKAVNEKGVNKNLLYNIELFRAYQKSSIEEISKIEEPISPVHSYPPNTSLRDLKTFYTLMIELDKSEKDGSCTLDKLIAFEKTMLYLCSKNKDSYFAYKLFISLKIAEKLEDSNPPEARLRLQKILDEIHEFEAGK